MLLPKFKIEDALDIPEERFHGLIYDGKDRLWITDGFTAVYADAKGLHEDVAGWVPVAAIHYAREMGQDSIYLPEKVVRVKGATFERSQENCPKTDVLEGAWGKADDHPILVSVDLKRLVPVLQALLEANDAENYETVACSIRRGKGREEDTPLHFVTRVGKDVHAILMPMRNQKEGESPYPTDRRIDDPHWHVGDFDDDYEEEEEEEEEEDEEDEEDDYEEED